MPNVILQALALKKPVISYDCKSGPREILENGNYGELIDIGDHKTLQNKIELALTDQLKYKYPYQLFVENFSLKKIGNKYFKLIK